MLTPTGRNESHGRFRMDVRFKGNMANTTIAELMSTTPANLAKRQKDALTEFVCDRLETIVMMIRCGEYSAVKSMLQNSPSGDGMGEDNAYINFSDSGCGQDIGDMIHVLERLASVPQPDSE